MFKEVLNYEYLMIWHGCQYCPRRQEQDLQLREGYENTGTRPSLVSNVWKTSKEVVDGPRAFNSGPTSLATASDVFTMGIYYGCETAISLLR